VACEENTGEDGTRKEQELAIAEEKPQEITSYASMKGRHLASACTHSLTHSLSLSRDAKGPLYVVGVHSMDEK
jgi:hypothetical protein